MFTRIFRLLWFFVFTGIPVANAWGPGHDDIQRAIMDRLPAALKSTLSQEDINKLITVYSHYPDSFEPFELSVIGQESMERLKKENITKRYDVHGDRNRAVAFLELVYALREKNIKRANFWIACLAHSAADMSALNHDPMTHVVFYVWGEEKQTVKTPFGNYPQFMDLRDVAAQPLGLRIYNERVDAMRLKDNRAGLKDALLEIMLYGHSGAHFLATRGFGILDASMKYADSRDEAILPELYKNMSDLGAWAVVRILRDVEIAVRLAASDVATEMPGGIGDLYTTKVDEHLKNRLLDDGMYQAIIPFQANQSAIATGILAEPSWRMNDGLIGFTERILGFEIANSFRKGKRPFRLLDVRNLLQTGFPDPKTTPVVILPVRQSNKTYFWMKTSDLAAGVKTYLAAGGKIIWIGGDKLPVEIAGEVEGSMVKSDNGKWPVPFEDLTESTVQMSDGAGFWKFEGALQPKVGWQAVQNSQVFDARKVGAIRFRPLLQLEKVGMEKVIIAACWPIENPSFAYLPGYTIVPFLLKKNNFLPVPVSEASLDSAGQDIITHTITVLSGK